MDFAFNEEQRILQASAQVFCAAHASSEQVRLAMASAAGYDVGAWQKLREELGWSGIAIPEQYGGLGLGQIEIGIVQTEMGRTLFSSPFFASSCLAAPAILHAGSESQRARWLPDIASGNLIATLAVTGFEGRPGIQGIEMVLRPSGEGYILSGNAGFVVLGHCADLIVIAACNADDASRVSLVALPRGTNGIRCEKKLTLDLTRPYAALHCDDVVVSPDQLLGEYGGAAEALRITLALGNLALAAEQCGGAEQCLTFSVEYAKQREQFGRPIGSFQAIKHKLADMMTLVEAAKSAVYYATCTADEEPQELFEAAAVAKSFCADAFFQCAATAIQIHGGIGYTWEHDAQLYFKRARASLNLLGDVRHLREQLATQLFDGEIQLLARSR